jgi:hypothetical protein
MRPTEKGDAVSLVRRAGVGVVVVASLALTGCGGGSSGGTPVPSGVSAKACMATTCSAVLDWLTAIQGQVQTFKTQEASATSLKEARSGLVSLLGQTVQDTNAMIGKVKSQGAPAVSGGQAVHAKLLSAFGKVRSELATAQQKASQLPTDDAAAFRRGATQIGADINTQLSGIGSSISDFGSQLDAAETADPNCQKLNSSSSG